MKYPKQHKPKYKGTSSNQISFGNFGLQAVEHARITARQIESGRRALVRCVRRGGKIWVRVYASKPITGKPAEVRMGRGKGAVNYMAAIVKPGRVLYELGGLVNEQVAKEAMLVASSKFGIRTRFITSK